MPDTGVKRGSQRKQQAQGGDGRVIHATLVPFPHVQGKSGAGEGIRTLDPNLGKVVLYP